MFTLKGIELLIKSEKFPQCFRSDMSCAQEEAVNQVVEFISWIHSLLVNSFVAFTTLFLVILPLLSFYCYSTEFFDFKEFLLTHRTC